MARSTFSSENVQNMSAPDHFLKLRCRKIGDKYPEMGIKRIIETSTCIWKWCPKSTTILLTISILNIYKGPASSPRFRGHLHKGLQSTTPATQIVAKVPRTSTKVSKVPHLPRKSSLRSPKYHACHAKSHGATGVPLRRQGSADIYTKASKVPHLPLKSSPRFRGHLQRSPKYHTCHTNPA